MPANLFPYIAIIMSVTLPVTKVAAAEADVMIAVATNFVSSAESLTKDFEARFGWRASLVAGSSGNLYAQLQQGAPFDVFLSADAVRPQRLVDAGLVADKNHQTYAIGSLVAWFPNHPTEQLQRVEAVSLILASSRIAHANEAVAPYGAATIDTLRSLAVYAQVKPRLVRGENIGQTYSLASSGNVGVGFIALAQHLKQQHKGGFWIVGESLHTPIRQNAVLMNRAANNPAAIKFFAYLRSNAAQQIIRDAGYQVPP